MSYECIVDRISVRKHPNADRLQVGVICGEQVIVDLSVQTGDLMLYFPEGGQLAEKFATGNDLISRKNPDGSRAGGFFSEKRRVVAQGFRGVKSHGFAIDPGALRRAGYGVDLADLREGMKFSTIGGEEVCCKYITPATLRASYMRSKTRKSRDLVFPEHVDTGQLAHCLTSLPTGVCYITEKLHGTSARYGKVLERIPNGWLRRLLGLPERSRVVPVAGTRRVVLDPLTGKETEGYRGSNVFRFDVLDPSTLRDGEIVYGEIVGYDSNGRLIMGRHDASKLSNEFQVKFGNEIEYTYGCEPGTHKMYVYRICNTTLDGRVVDLPWPAVVGRCKELGLVPVPIIRRPHHPGDMHVYAGLMIGVYHDARPSELGGMAEGIVLRIEHANGVSFYKHKCYEFKVMEGIIKANDSYVDEEEAS